MLVYDEKNKTFVEKELNFWDMVFFLANPFPSITLIANIVNAINGKLSTDDAENINQIIEQGRKQNVAEMEIEVSRDVATGISIANSDEYDVTIGTKGKTQYVIKVKYK